MTRATVGLLFSDIEGSTRLLQQLGPTYAELLLAHRRLMRAGFEAHDGVERGVEGDSFFVTFPTASDAAAAALETQRALLSQGWSPRPDVSVRVRMGVHVGEIEEVAGAVIGLAVHESARIASAAHGGQVLGSDRAAQLVSPLPDGAGWLNVGEHRLKDVEAPVRLFQLTHPDLPTEFPPVRAQGSVRNNLPVQPSSFVGRHQEMAEVQRLLHTSRLVTVTGTGGSGKSRIALRVAAEESARFADGVWLVDLAPVADHAGVVEQIGASLGLTEAGQPDLFDALAARQLLLVLDNCEHLVETVSDAAHQLLHRCSQLTVLATSREPLGVQGESVWRIPPLDLADASDLLAARARSVNSRFAITAVNRTAVEEVCRRLDAIPLALELAAARLASLTVQQLAVRLDQRFRLLTGSGRGVMERHRTLQATVDWSYDLLTVEEQAALCRVGVFVGGFSLEAAEAVCVHPEQVDVYDLLDRLVLKSLIIAEEREGLVRYRLLETVRQYALDKLAHSADLGSARDAHLRWLAQLAAQAEATLWFGGDETAWLNRLDDEDDNIRTGLDWAIESGHVEMAADLVFGVFGWLTARGRAREGLRLAQRLHQGDLTGEHLAIMSFAEMAFASNVSGLQPGMVDRVRQTTQLLNGTPREWVKPIGEAYCAAWSYPAGDRAAATAAVPICERAVQAVAGYGPGLLGWALQALMWVQLDAGNLDAARSCADDGLGAVTAAGLSIGESRMALNRARIAAELHDLDSAWTFAERAARVARATGETFVVAQATRFMAKVAEQQRNLGLARDLLVSVLDAVADSQSEKDLDDVRESLARYTALAEVKTVEAPAS